MAKIITFSGKAGAGKNVCACFIRTGLQQKGLKVFEIAYADWLKAILTKNFGYSEEKKKDFRDVLQHFGTDVVRNKDPDFWVKIVMMTVELLEDEFDVFLLTDARFENELQPFALGREHDVYNILVRRDSIFDLTGEQIKHSSEQLCEKDMSLFTSIIRNDGSLADLCDKCDDYVDYFVSWIKESEAA